MKYLILLLIVFFTTGFSKAPSKKCKAFYQPKFEERVSIVSGFYKGYDGVVESFEYNHWDNDCSPARLKMKFEIKIYAKRHPNKSRLVIVEDYDLRKYKQ